MARKFALLESVGDSLPAGKLLSPPEAMQINTSGAGLIPIDDRLLHIRSAIAGLSVMQQGDGWEIPLQSGPLCPIALYMHAHPSLIHWRALIQLDDARDRSGSLRLIADTAQAGQRFTFSTSAVDLKGLQNSPRGRLYVVGASASIRDHGEGLAGFALWGTSSTPARVLWLAVSQTVIDDTPSSYNVGPMPGSTPNEREG